MQVPRLLEAKYQADHKLSSWVSTALARIDDHVRSNRMVFFPEYTDHGISHLELVLQTAFDLATNDARDLLTPNDAAGLVVAVALHDFGMYLTRDGFETLISKGSAWHGVRFFNDKPWDELWGEFYAEATRFDDRKLRALFGENYRPVRPLPLKGQQWEDFDYLLVGEFLRRHHPRLAHEIALYGLPGKDGQTIPVCSAASEEQRFWTDMAGMVARSHGMDLRPCLGFLETQYNNRINPRNSHPIFLAVLLRIADYFQIQAPRAPAAHTDVVSFRSPLSDREWKVHQSVTDIYNTGQDPEAIVINAKPGDVETFLRLKAWLSGIQGELDLSWAVIGEVYGLQAHTKLNQLGLRIRRVKSNLDDVASFSKTVPYVPAKIAFEAANADLLKLLVAPLYGNDPGIGIRELIQNAIDAVREFEGLIAHYPELASVERYSQTSDVALHIECDEDGLPTEVILTDRGVGMTAQTVRDYFLKAGASLRQSDSWRREHEDANGRSRVLRTGRFGVGALAAFLLGDQIEVTTRFALSPADEGITFSARLDDEAISLNRTECPVGTTIRIRVPKEMQDQVSEIVPSPWQDVVWFGSALGHYFLKRPSLERTLSTHTKPIKPIAWLPLPDEDASIEWKCFSNSDFQKIFWNYLDKYPRLSANGIVVTNILNYHSAVKISIPVKYIQPPNLSVFDKDGYLPVDLKRTGLQTSKLPFERDLLRNICDDLIAHAIVEGLYSCEGKWLNGVYEGFRKPRADYGLYTPEWARWFVGRDGFVLNDPHLIKQFNPKLVVVAIGGTSGYQNWGDQVRKSLPPDTLLASHLPEIFSSTNPKIKSIFSSVVDNSLHVP